MSNQVPNVGAGGGNTVYQVVESVYQLAALPAVAPTGTMNIFPQNVASGLTNYFDADGTVLTSALEGDSCKFYGGKWIKQPFRFHVNPDIRVPVAMTVTQVGNNFLITRQTPIVSLQNGVEVLWRAPVNGVVGQSVQLNVDGLGLKNAVKPNAEAIMGDEIIADDYYQSVYYSDSDSWVTFGIAGSSLAKATQAQAEAGTENIAYMTALRTAQAIKEQGMRNVVKFAVQDGDTDTDGSTLSASKIGLYNNGVQVQNGKITQTTDIFLPKQASTFGQDPTSPGTNLSEMKLYRVLDVLAEDGGAAFLYIKPQANSAIDLYVESALVTKVGTVGYKLSGLSWKKSDYTFSGSGVGWNVIVSWDFLSLAANIVDLDDKLAAYVQKTDLEGHESDRYASYTNAFIAASGDRRGSISLFNTDTGPPTDANAVRQPDIADRATNGIIAFGATLRTDRDPNNLVWADTNVPGHYVSGQKIVVSVWNKPEARVVVTLTSGGTLVDTGNAAYIWAYATWDEVEDIPDVTEVGNYFLLSEEEPSSLDVRLPASDILNPVDLISAAFRLGMLTGVEETDASLSAATKLLLDNFNEVSLGELFEHHDQNHTGFTELTGYNFKTGSQTPNAGDVAYDAALPGGSTGAYYIKPKTDDDKALLKKILIAHKTVYFEVDATRFVKFQPTGTPTELFGRLVGSYAAGSFEEQGEGLTNNHAITLDIASNIPARSEYRNIAFKAFAWNNLTRLTSLADDDSLLAWDSSTGTVVRIDKSDLVDATAETSLASNVGRKTTNTSQFNLTSTQITAIRTAVSGGKDIKVVLKATDVFYTNTHRIAVVFYDTGNTTFTSKIIPVYLGDICDNISGDRVGYLRFAVTSTTAQLSVWTDSGAQPVLDTNTQIDVYSIG